LGRHLIIAKLWINADTWEEAEEYVSQLVGSASEIDFVQAVKWEESEENDE
jgi:hypothetical protein